MWKEVKVLLIDDDKERARDIDVVLRFLGEGVVSANFEGWQQALDSHSALSSNISCVVLGRCDDIDKMSGLLDQLTEWDPSMPMLLVGDTLEDLPEALASHNVVETICLPLSYNKLLDSLHRAQVYREHSAITRNRDQGHNAKLFRSLVGSSKQVIRVREMMAQVADKDVTVLITGASGTGKEVVARNLHYSSPRKDKPFVPVNCGAIPSELLESELFGHEKGAFTGAVSTRQGRFEMAQGGTLFLDEIGDMPLHMQVKILRVLQERSFERVGSNQSIKTDVRIIAATHGNLESMIA
ncbi:MAG: sigma-54 specific flagellar transcriptional regulator A, partial [Candidatus Azotimanducaceae bacterium]